MAVVADRPIVPSMDEGRVRHLLPLAIAFSLAITSAAIGFYPYVVIPLWILFALSSRRFDSSQALRTARRLLALSLILWVAFTIPLFFFLLVFAPLIYAAEVSAIFIGTALMYLAADSSSGSPRIATARIVGLAAGAATAAILLIVGALLALAIAGRIPAVEVTSVYVVLSIGALVPSMSSALAFIGIAMWARKRVSATAQP